MDLSFKKFLTFKQSGKKFSLISFDSYKDWKVVIYLFGLIFVGVILWSGNIFLSVENGTAYTVVDSFIPATPLPSTIDLEHITTEASVKAIEFAKWSSTSSVPTIVDPSL